VNSAFVLARRTAAEADDRAVDARQSDRSANCIP
jgi:hypothetical protein